MTVCPAAADDEAAMMLQVVWPIIDDTYTLAQLISEADAQLGPLAAQAHAVISGQVSWRTATATEVPGWSAYPGLLLVAEAPATASRSPHPDPQARIDTIRTLAEAAYTDRQIAAMLGLTRSNVAVIRQRNAIPSAHRSTPRRSHSSKPPQTQPLTSAAA